jgi:hypothetical protein
MGGGEKKGGTGSREAVPGWEYVEVLRGEGAKTHWRCVFSVDRGRKLMYAHFNVRLLSNVPIDVIIFTFYSDQLTIDVETGIVTKQFFCRTKYYY